MEQYYTDSITNLFCNYYNNNITKSEMKEHLKVLKKKDLINYLIDSFNLKTLNSDVIAKIPINIT